MKKKTLQKSFTEKALVGYTKPPYLFFNRKAFCISQENQNLYLTLKVFPSESL